MNEKKICACVGARTRDTQKSKEHYEENFIPAGWNLEYTCLDQPEAALAHAQACAAVIHRMPLLIAGALSAWLCHRQEDCRFFLNRMEAEIQRKHQSDATLRWIEALVRQDEKQLAELSLQSDPLAGPLQKKLVQLRFQTLVRLGKTELACRLIEQAEL